MSATVESGGSARAIGIFGGTFDPIHNGHLHAAEAARDRLRLAELRFVPAGHPPLRAAPVASAEQRRAMVELAIGSLRGFRVDDRELRSATTSYTVLTLEALRSELPGIPLCLLIGMDQFQAFERWHRWQDILQLAHLAVWSRPGTDAGVLPGWARTRLTDDFQELHGALAGRLAFLPVRPQDISASRIRAALAQGGSVAGLMPEPVLDYIRTNHLYGYHGRGA